MERFREDHSRGNGAGSSDSVERTVSIPRPKPVDIVARFGAQARERARLAVSTREGQ